MKPNCYECRHRGTVPGDAHSCCHHPEVDKRGGGDVFTAIVSMLTGDMAQASAKLHIQANPHGVRNGWFMWPFNFDPVWLENCTGFEKREPKEAV